MYYLYLCICTSAKCMSVNLKVYLFIWSHNFRSSVSLSLSPNSLYRQTTDCIEGGGLTREHCIYKKILLFFFLLLTLRNGGSYIWSVSSLATRPRLDGWSPIYFRIGVIVKEYNKSLNNFYLMQCEPYLQLYHNKNNFSFIRKLW
jgi:hypothetical protein